MVNGYTVLWMVALLGLLHWARPNEQMRAHFDGVSRASYYVFWLLAVGGFFAIHYAVLAPGGHGLDALCLDATAPALYVLGYLALRAIRHRSATAPVAAAESSASSVEGRHLSCSWTAQPNGATYTGIVSYAPKGY